MSNRMMRDKFLEVNFSEEDRTNSGEAGEEEGGGRSKFWRKWLRTGRNIFPRRLIEVGRLDSLRRVSRNLRYVGILKIKASQHAIKGPCPSGVDRAEESPLKK